MQISDWLTTIYKWLFSSSVLTVQYFVFTIFVFLIFYVWKKKELWYLKIQERYPDNKHIVREITYSIITIFILGAILTFLVWANKHHLTQVYKPIDKYGWGYYFFSVILMIFVHDAYFYWTHRFMHWKRVFKYVHKLHHQSTNPTVFTAFSLHPIEAVIQMSIIPLVVFTIPHHISVPTVFGTYSLILNVGGHLGFEFFPKWMARHKILQWHNTATHHNMHHTNVKANYGLYFNIWDRLMNTNSKGYVEHFEELVDQRVQKKHASAELPAELQKSEAVNNNEVLPV